MNWKRYRMLIAVVIVSIAAGSMGFAQTSADAVAKVPALDDFHEVIHQIFHEALPKKDTAMLHKLAPEVEKGIKAVAAAPLPGILREKKAAWKEGVKKLQSAGAEYKAAAAAKDDRKLPAAAEALHSRFAALMHSISPTLKELDDFHTTLYMLFHYYLPQHETEKIKSSAAELRQKMAALNAAQLPEPLKQKEAEFQAARSKLAQSVDALEPALRKNQEKAVKTAIELVHANYQALAKII
jgi:hypothetical protein